MIFPCMLKKSVHPIDESLLVIAIKSVWFITYDIGEWEGQLKCGEDIIIDTNWWLVCCKATKEKIIGNYLYWLY